ncbi:MAG TPA: LuxR C-terminal-related transcriptional regulator [Jatrophihabitantaceae bacterium]|nr:LuxR C-terminal-related transcriptional regulator [Jatrophihabitantaceae bacterium]
MIGVPRLPERTIERSRLYQRLDDACMAPLTVLCGPAGSGKTVLLSSWLATTELPGPVAWLQCENLAGGDGFWATVLVAVRRTGAFADDHPLMSIDLGAQRHALRDELLRAFGSLAAPLFIVLDDVHLVVEPDAMADVRALSHHCANLRFIVASRRRLPLASPRDVISGDAVEIGAAELAFTRDEATELLTSFDSGATAEILGELLTITGGWPAAVSLTIRNLLVSNQAQQPDVGGFAEFTVAATDAFCGYIAEEILANLSEEKLNFLLRLSIVDEVTPALAAELSGESDCLSRLQDLAAGDVLMAESQASSGRMFRCHRLLLNSLREEHSARFPAEIPKLHAIAAAWYRDDGQSMLAVRHAYRASDWQLLIDLLRSAAVFLLADHPIEIREAIFAMPEVLWRTDPELLVYLGSTYRSGQVDPLAGGMWVRLADEARQAAGCTTSLSADLLIDAGLLAVEQFNGDTERARRLGEATMERLRTTTRGEAMSVGAAAAIFYAAYAVGQLFDGELTVAGEVFRAAESSAQVTGHDGARFECLANLTLIEALLGSGEQAGAYLAKGSDLASSRGWLTVPAAQPLHLGAALLAIDRGDHEEAFHRLACCREADGYADYLPFAVYTEALAYLLAGHGAMADAALARMRAGPGERRFTAFIRDLGASARALIQLRGGDSKAGLATLNGITSDPAHVICVPALRALAHLYAGEAEQARVVAGTCLGQAEHLLEELAPRVAECGPDQHARRTLLDLLAIDASAGLATSDPDGALRRFQWALAVALTTGARRQLQWMSRSALLTLLARARAVDTSDLLEELATDLQALAGSSRRANMKLTPREQLIMSYLSTDATQSEIAKLLYVSPNTLKSHVRSIYRKLGAASRADAVQRMG